MIENCIVAAIVSGACFLAGQWVWQALNGKAGASCACPSKGCQTGSSEVTAASSFEV